jgi:hypothetical protein
MWPAMARQSATSKRSSAREAAEVAAACIRAGMSVSSTLAFPSSIVAVGLGQAADPPYLSSTMRDAAVGWAIAVDSAVGAPGRVRRATGGANKWEETGSAERRLGKEGISGWERVMGGARCYYCSSTDSGYLRVPCILSWLV